MDIRGKKIILGSHSPRRKELLAGLGFPFTIDTENTFSERIPKGVRPEKIPVLMSEGKSEGFHRPLENDEILITSDTLVLCGGQVLGKPKNREDAERMLRLISGREHAVITAATIRDQRRRVTLSDKSLVRFKPLSDEEIDYYIDNYKPYDKAGAYGVQEWIGYIGITGITGSFYTVMGFPIQLVYESLREFIEE